MRGFLEIGSCYFNTLNDFSDNNWKGVIVEPVEKYINLIPRKKNVTYLNCAVDTTKGERTLYMVNQAQVELDSDYAGMSTFHKWPFTDTIPIQVETKTYQEVVSEGELESIDYLKIDTEGHDWVILQNVIFEGPLRPKYIKVEHKHSNGAPMVEYLTSRGYNVYVMTDDLFAICTSLIAATTNP
jgi:FkbM family methyltransferase